MTTDDSLDLNVLVPHAVIPEEEDACFYLPSMNEAGWRISRPVTGDVVLGFRPDLDRRLLYRKVMGLLTELHIHDFLFVSNGDEGEYIVRDVMRRCMEVERYDQYTILLAFFTDENVGVEGHGAYWATAATQWMAEHPSYPTDSPSA